ncbi:Lamin-like protein [Apostasia shenzhenica]|uniref:Lamin-like protein n=1 Tax=Apostasia shenzhenica TaxID=1088818 RepID=A0A2I0AWH2_9ASPA|nr:Lamin-like protein [Apostasia shenzhenica]
MHNVVQVSASDYERCATDHPISSWSAGRSYLTQLKAAGRYYYICSRGNFCNAGMKIAVVVAQRPAPAHSRFESSAESYSRRSGGAAVLVGSMVAGSVAWGICAAGSLL